MNICGIVGTKFFYRENEKYDLIKNTLIDLIENKGVTQFYSGDYSEFDWAVAKILYNLKSQYDIQSYLILAYMPKPKNYKNEYKYNLIEKYYDSTILADVENVPKQFAIIKQSHWLVDKSRYLITYCPKSYGGAFKTKKYAESQAKKRDLTIIELSN